MNYTRRVFLRQAAVLLASIGVSQTMMAAAARRCYQALAKPTPRKFAVLVGIDQYPQTVCSYPSPYKLQLSGCVTDVRLQQELLIHRFGFHPENIVALLNADATRQAIEESCLSHLVEQVQPGDVVVFHFSGLGSQVSVLDDDSKAEPQLKNSLVPVDGVLPTATDGNASSGERPVLNDILEDTLLLLLRSLPTKHIVTCLDISFGAPETLLSSSLRLRSRVSIPQGYLADDEVALQTRLSQRSRGKKEIIEPSLFPGLLLNAAPSPQGAFEYHWNGFSAGLFTYALTQQLWWLTADTSLAASISLAGAKVEQVVGSQRQPLLSGQSSDKPALENHRFQPIQSMGADGVVVGTNTETAGVQIFLGGLPATVLENYGVMSLLQLFDPSDNAQSPPSAAAASTSSSTGIAIPKVSYGNYSLDLSNETSGSNASGSSAQPGNAVPDGRANEDNGAKKGNGASKSDDTESGDSDSVVSTPQASADPEPSGAEPQSSPEAMIVQVRLRDGLVVRAKPFHTQQGGARVSVGQLACERTRVLSKNINLIVALDSRLERIERVDATSALSGIARMSSVVAGEQPADVLFGKAKSSKISAKPKASPGDVQSEGDPTDSLDTRPAEGKGYGLFYLSHEPIQNTIESNEEAVKTAVNRLAPKLRNLLALKLLRLTDNQGSSQLGVRATLELLAPQERILIQQTTFRAPWDAPDNRLAKLFAGDGVVPLLSAGSTIRYRLQNYSDRPVYCVLLGLDARGNAIAISPSIGMSKGAGDAPEASDSIILPGSILTMPQAGQSAKWVVGGPVGLADTYIETYAVFSREPLERTTEALSKEMRPMGNFRQLSLVSNPMNVVQALLMDLSEASRKDIVPGADISSDAYALNMQTYASLSFVYRVG